MTTLPPEEKPTTATQDDATPPSAQVAEEKRSRFSPANTLASLKYRDFTFLWLGQMSHAGAMWMEIVATPMLILAITGSPMQLGMILMVRTVASMLLGPIAGVMADTFNRRFIMIVTQLPVLVVSAVYAVVILLGLIELWHIYAFTVFRGVTMAFDQPARRAMIPSIVPEHLVTNAVTLSMGSLQVMRISSAAAGGLLITLFGIEAVFIAIAAFYGPGLLFTYLLRVPDHRRSGYQGIHTAGSDLLDGLKFAWRSPVIRGMVVISMAYFFFGMNFLRIFGAIFTTQGIMDIGETGFGLLVSVSGVGGILGAFVLATLSPNKHRGIILLTILTSLGIMLMLYSVSTYLDSIPMFFVMVALLGFIQAWVLPLVTSSLLLATPENMRGRILGLTSLDRGMTAAGGAAAGFLAAAMGSQEAQFVLGAACLIITIVLFTVTPSLRRL